MKNTAIPNMILTDSDGDMATIYLYGYIGQDLIWYGEERKKESLRDIDVLNAIKGFEKAGKTTLHVRINSNGGSITHMDGIISIMQSSKMDIHTWVDGVAASAASSIFLAAKKENRHMARNAKIMLHTPSSGGYGNAKFLRGLADMLDKYQEAVIAQLSADMDRPEEEIERDYFDGNDHWLSAKDAEAAGMIAGIESFEAENVPDSPDMMSEADWQKHFETTAPTMTTKLTDQTLFNTVKSAILSVFPQAGAGNSPNTEEMNFENFKNSLQAGDIAMDDVVQHLQANGYNVELQEAAPTTDANTELLKTIQASLEKLGKDMNSVTARMTALEDGTPGAPPTLPKGEQDAASMEEDGETDPQLSAAEETFAQALKQENHRWG